MFVFDTQNVSCVVTYLQRSCVKTVVGRTEMVYVSTIQYNVNQQMGKPHHHDK